MWRQGLTRPGLVPGGQVSLSTSSHAKSWTCSGIMAVLGAATIMCGCASEGTTTSSLGIAAPAALEIPKIDLPKLAAGVKGTPTEVYTRVAHGAVTCWLGPNGPLKGTHIFHAEAAPPSKGGRSELSIHLKDLTAPTPRGTRVFRVVIEPYGETAAVESENLRVAEPLGTRMKDDVHRWSTGHEGCAPKEIATGWAAAPGVAAAKSAAKKAKAK